MADDRTPPSTTEPESVEEIEEKDEVQGDGCTGSDRGRGTDANRGEEEGTSSGYFSRMFEKTIGGDDLEKRIELIDKEEESLESRIVLRERTAEQVNRSMIFLSVNLEFVAGIYAYLRIRSRSLSWKARAVRILPMFLVPALASFFYSLFSRFTSMLNFRDSRSLERLRKEREAKIQELKERANYYMAKRHIQNCHAESSSMASSSGLNLPETSNIRDKSVNPNLSWVKGKNIDANTSTDHDTCIRIVNDEKGKKKLRNLVICSTCRMHNGFASRDELPFLSYKCPHCNALNGPHKEQDDCDSVSTSGKGTLQSQPYNPFSIQEMPRGILIEEITPNHETTDPEMEPAVMIIRESPSIGGVEELRGASNLDSVTAVAPRKLPTGLSIVEMTSNGETNDAEMEPPVMIIPESPAAVTTPMVRETARGLSIEEINPNDQQIEDHEVIPPVVFVQESPSVDGQAELLSSQNRASITEVTLPEMPNGLSIEEMTPNQEMEDPEMEPPVTIIRESPSSGAPVMEESSFVTPFAVQEIANGLSIEEVSPNHQLTEAFETNLPVMFVEESPSLGGQEFSASTPDSAAESSVTAPRMPDFSIEELSPNQQGYEDSQMDSALMIIQESPSVGERASVTPLEVPDLDDTMNPDGSVRSPNDSVSFSTPGSSTITGSSVTFQDLTELDEEEIDDNDVPGGGENESFERYLHDNTDVHQCSVNATTVTGQESLTTSHLPSESESGIDDDAGGNCESDSNSWRSVHSGPAARMRSMAGQLSSKSQQMERHEMNATHPNTDFNLPYSESETDSDYGSFTDVNEEEVTQDPETRIAAGGVVAGSSGTVLEENSRNAAVDQNELFTSAYDGSMDSKNDFRRSSWASRMMDSSVASGGEEQWSDWQQAEGRQSESNSEKKLSDSLNLITAGSNPVEESQILLGEMPPVDAREEVESLEGVQQEGPERSVSGISDAAEESLSGSEDHSGHGRPNHVDAAEESLSGSEDYSGHGHPNRVGSVAYDRDKGSVSQNLKKGVGGTKTDNVLQGKKKREGIRVKEAVLGKNRSIKYQVIKPEPIMKAPTALICPNLGSDHQSRPFTSIVSSPVPQWGTDTDFEPGRAVGLRHRR